LSLGTDIQLPERALSPDDLRLARRALTMLAVLGSGSMIGVAFSLYLVNHFPLLLIALSPLGRHLVLVAPIVDPIAFLCVSVGRRLLFYLGSYDLGRALGASGISWIERRAAYFARFVRWIERLFERAPKLVVLFISGPTVSALAGISGMSRSMFLGLASVSVLVRMLLILGFAEMVREPIEIALAWIDEYWVPGTAVMVVGVLIFQWIRIRSARRARVARNAEG
jgi:hypothetical protein